MNKFLKLLPFLFLMHPAFSQPTPDKDIIRGIYDEALSKGTAYDMLADLTGKIGPRLTGSTGAAKAVEWSNRLLKNLNLDSVWLQPVTVPQWIRGQKEIGQIKSKNGKQEVAVCALGGSVETGSAGITAGVVEVKNFDELKQLGAKAIQGKIVFFNRPMDPKAIYTLMAYMGAINQRSSGASEAAKLGAVAAIVRSLSPNPEDYPHTGAVRYEKDVPKIPAIAISTKHADLLSKLLTEDKDLQFYLETHCETRADVESYNVIGEIKGSEVKDEIILVSGHLDSWDLAQGAQDDGAGCVQSIEVARLLKAVGYKPKRTIRVVRYMNEEDGFRGAIKYAALAAKNREKHIAAIESDGGGFTPRGFTMSGDENAKTKIRSWKSLFEPYELYDFGREGGGADIGQLASQGVLQIGFYPDSQRYFGIHHTKEDTFDKVDRRELELGAAAMASLVFLLDRYGIK